VSVSISPNSAPAETASRTLKVGGITPFSATDFPGKLACVVFVQGCPWQCGYCHNPHLQPRTGPKALEWSGILDLLRRRVGLIDAVVFSGGEPCIDPMLGQAIDDVRALGFQVGLHTGGAYPARLASVLERLDWVGLDIKAPFEDYERITGVPGSGQPARECAEMLIKSGVKHEVRTTLHPAQLAEPDILQLAGTLAQLKVRNYALQVFRPVGCASAPLNAVATTGYPSEALVERITPLFGQLTLRRA
jgi:pyruvate formate lyase activating enzyme